MASERLGQQPAAEQARVLPLHVPHARHAQLWRQLPPAGAHHPHPSSQDSGAGGDGQGCRGLSRGSPGGPKQPGV